jgi:hypothetical protein|tara:strand:+ start:3061 stop:3417 length:357 start_codon:yes stop_codon:yes gene_type:complete
MDQLNNIKRMFKVIDNSLFTINGTLSYDRLTDSIIKLADMVDDYPMSDDGYELWNIGEYGNCSLDNLIIGAYWHYTEYHSGQNSLGYAALSSLGQVFSPNMSMPENDNEAYIALNNLQ